MKQATTTKALFWSIICILVCGCSYFILHNAVWLLGDDCQTLIYTGWDKPIFGFFVSPTVGRFFPLDYTIYDVLCLFYDDQIPASAHYFIHVICFILFVWAFIWLSLHILKDLMPIWQYSITLCVVMLIIGRTFINFAQLWTGIWTIFTFLPVFILCSLKFLETNKWSYGIAALLAINYILYYYETMFLIPITIGAVLLLFGYFGQNKYSKSERLFFWSLIISGCLFLILYGILVLPQVEHFYSHHIDSSKLVNGLKMLYAQKILWLIIVFLVLRFVQLCRRSITVNFYDSLLVAAFIFYIGSAYLGLNYTLYYTPAAIIAIPAILEFSLRYFDKKCTLVLFVVLALFYGRKLPRDIIDNQNNRVSTYENVQTLIKEIGDGCLYFYEPENRSMELWELDIRSIRKFYLQTVTGWYMHKRDFSSEKKESFDGSKGFWQVVPEDDESFVLNCPDAECVVDFGDSKVYRLK